MVMVNENTQDNRGKTLSLSLAILESLENAGLALVPEQPTKEMLVAGAAAGDIDTNKAAKIYTAILDDAS